MAFDTEFQQLLAASKASILSKTRDSSVNTTEFRRLLALLQSFSTNNGAELFAVVMNLDCLSKLNFSTIGDNLNKRILIELQQKNHFIVDEEFNIISHGRKEFENSSQARQIYLEMSSDSKCVILLDRRTAYPHYFVNGNEVGEATFFTEADYKQFKSLRDISEVLDVIEDFRNELTKQSIYSHFFVPKSTLKVIYGADTSKNPYKGKASILRNRPEDHLRQELKNFLTNSINRSFNFFRETHMDNSGKRLDIIGEDEIGNIYFFEVKWMGQSIGPDDNKIVTTYDEEKVLSGADQTLQYIQEWQSNGRTVKMGCLVVFDARNDKYNYKNAAFIAAFDKVINNYTSCKAKFNKIEDLLLENTHPS